MLSQLTRYGNIEEPEHEDDIAYITPEMLAGQLSTRSLIGKTIAAIYGCLTVQDKTYKYENWANVIICKRREKRFKT